MLANVFLGNSVKRNRAYADRDLIEEFSDDLPRTLRANPIVEVPANVLLVNRVMGLMSGLGKTLDSQVNLFATLMPFTQSLMAEMTATAKTIKTDELAIPRVTTAQTQTIEQKAAQTGAAVGTTPRASGEQSDS